MSGDAWVMVVEDDEDDDVLVVQLNVGTATEQLTPERTRDLAQAMLRKADQAEFGNKGTGRR